MDTMKTDGALTAIKVATKMARSAHDSTDYLNSVILDNWQKIPSDIG